jgi:lipopolysaccharide export LptBFGC system permease protein LptF
MAAKRAYSARQITAQQYEDAIWVLKMNRKRRIEAEKANLRARTITEQEYERRVRQINLNYKGQ